MTNIGDGYDKVEMFALHCIYSFSCFVFCLACYAVCDV